jgi:hypothetical protein
LLLFSMSAMGQLFGRVAFWVADVTVLSAILALIEIVIEKDRGWASALGDRGWGRKFLAGTRVVRWIDKPYVTSYHLLVFGTLLPATLCAQYAMGAFGGFGSAPRAGHPIGDFLLLFSAFLAICVFEDFLWFALNWYYPGSLADLLAGEIWWHTNWIRLGPAVKLPRFYIAVGGIAICLLAAGCALSK